MINTNIEYLDTKSIYTLQQKNGELIFSIDTPRNFLPYGQTFTIITMNLECYENNIESLFRDLIDTSYSFEPIDEIFGNQKLKGYCVYAMSFDEAMSMGDYSSRNAILYADQNRIGYYDKKTYTPLFEISFVS